jgi:hypothetical protein
MELVVFQAGREELGAPLVVCSSRPVLTSWDGGRFTSTYSPQGAFPH